jgi:hypothetical protein
MYIKVTKNQKGEAYHHLVESYRVGIDPKPPASQTWPKP